MVGLPARAQTQFGRISGTVTDQSGAIIAGAKVTITNAESQFSFLSFSPWWACRLEPKHNSGVFLAPSPTKAARLSRAPKSPLPMPSRNSHFFPSLHGGPAG